MKELDMAIVKGRTCINYLEDAVMTLKILVSAAESLSELFNRRLKGKDYE